LKDLQAAIDVFYHDALAVQAAIHLPLAVRNFPLLGFLAIY